MKISILILCILIFCVCSSQDLCEMLLNKNEDIYTNSVQILSSHYEYLRHEPFVNPTGKSVVLIEGVIENLKLPFYDREILRRLFRAGNIRSILMKDKNSVWLQYSATDGEYLWTSSYLVYLSNQVELDKMIDAKYQRVLLFMQCKKNAKWYNLVLQNTID